MNAARVKPQLEQNEDSPRFLQAFPKAAPCSPSRSALAALGPGLSQNTGISPAQEPRHVPEPACTAPQVPKPGLRVPPALVAPAVGGEAPVACFYPWDLALEDGHQTWPLEARIRENLDLSPSSSALPLVAIRFYL